MSLSEGGSTKSLGVYQRPLNVYKRFFVSILYTYVVIFHTLGDLLLVIDDKSEDQSCQ